MNSINVLLVHVFGCMCVCMYFYAKLCASVYTCMSAHACFCVFLYLCVCSYVFRVYSFEYFCVFHFLYIFILCLSDMYIHVYMRYVEYVLGSGVCVYVCTESPETQVGICFLVLADCALDEACSFFTIYNVGSEVTCDFYAWTSDNIICSTSTQVSHECWVVECLFLAYLCQTQSESIPGWYWLFQVMEWYQYWSNVLSFFKIMRCQAAEIAVSLWYLKMNLSGVCLWCIISWQLS